MAVRTTKSADRQPKAPGKTAERSMKPEGQSVADIVQHKLQVSADVSAEGDRNRSMQAMADQSRTVMQGRRMGEAMNEGHSADIMGDRALEAGGNSAETALQRSSENDHGQKGDITQLFKWPWESNYQKLDDGDDAEMNEREDDAAPLLGRGQRSDDYEEEVAGEEDSAGGFTAEAGGITYEDGVVTIPFLDDYELKIGTKGASASGSLPSSSFEMDLPSVDFGIDVPFAPGVYATAKLAITPTFKLSVAGGEYAVSVGDSNSLSLSDAAVTGEVGLEITAKGGVGAGLANVAGLEGGVFGTLGASATIAGSLGGDMDFANKAGSLKLGITAGADIYGKAGMFVTAKLAGLEMTKDFPLAEKKFAHFAYNRNISLGVDNESWKPTIEDFTKIEFGDKASGKRLKSSGGKMYEELRDED